MKIQAIAISLKDLKKIEAQIKKELVDIKKLGISKGKEDNIRFQFNIINYPTQSGNRKMYCSDTWEFEMLLRKRK